VKAVDLNSYMSVGSVLAMCGVVSVGVLCDECEWQEQ
jgi:hypothetical protein